MRYKEYNIVFQEIPNEVSLCLSITGCNLRCDGCHSPFLWKKNNGSLLSIEVLNSILEKYRNIISCVLFMGGEWYEEELIYYLSYIKDFGLKTALYTGLEFESIRKEIINNLDYLKYGPWIKDLGGLDSVETNQRLMDLKSGECLNHFFKPFTAKLS